MNAILIALAWIAAVAGGLFLTKITAGVGGICLGCFFAICYRINQAERHHKQMVG